MKKFLFLLIGLLSFSGISQNTDPIITTQSSDSRGLQFLGAVVVDSTLNVPVRGRDSIYTNVKTPYKGRIQVNSATNQLEYNNGSEWVVLSGKVDVVDTKDELENYDGEANTLIWRDTLRGGLFYVMDIVHDIDNGVYFQMDNGNIAVRQFNQADGLNVLWYGADPTGVADNRQIITDLIITHSEINQLIKFPDGNFKIGSTIGSIASGGTGTQLTRDVTLQGSTNTRIFVESAVEVQAIIAFEANGKQVTLNNIIWDGMDKANRGVYFRHISLTSPDFSSLFINDCDIKNVYVGLDPIEQTARGLTCYGKFQDFIVKDVNILSVKSGGGNHVTQATQTGGEDTNDRNPRNIRYENVYIKDVYRTDILTGDESDGIFIAKQVPTLPSDYTTVVIENCVMVNVRGRAIKSHIESTMIINPTIILETDFEMAADNPSGAIEIQYSDAVVLNPTFIFNNTDENYYRECIRFVERFGDNNYHRAITQNGRVWATGTIKDVIRIYEDTDGIAKAPIIVENFVVDCNVDNFIDLFHPTALTGTRNIIANNNIVKSINDYFIANPGNKDLNITCISNVHNGTAISVCENCDTSTLINNFGFTETNTYSTTGNVTTSIASALSSIGYGTTATANDNWNTITTSGLYRNTTSAATGIPVALANMAMYHAEVVPGGQAAQFSFSTNTNKMYFRRANSSRIWQTAQEVMTTGDAQTVTSIKTSTVVQKGINGIAPEDFTTKGQMDTALALKVDATSILSGSATLDFPSTAIGTSSELTITVTGAADGDVVSVGIPNASSNANSCFTARVSATNTVTVKFNNYSSGSIDPTSGTFKVKVFK